MAQLGSRSTRWKLNKSTSNSDFSICSSCELSLSDQTMIPTRTLLLSITSVAVAALGVWWLTAARPQQQEKSIKDTQNSEQRSTKQSKSEARCDGQSEKVVAAAPNTTSVVETPTPPATPVASPPSPSTNVTVREKTCSEEMADEEDFPESSPIAFDPDNRADPSAAQDELDTTQSASVPEQFEDSMVILSEEIIQEDNRRPGEHEVDCTSEGGDNDEVEVVEEDVHVNTEENMDESTNAIDISTSVLDMSTSALDESKDNLCDTDGQFVSGVAEQSEEGEDHSTTDTTSATTSAATPATSAVYETEASGSSPAKDVAENAGSPSQNRSGKKKTRRGRHGVQNKSSHQPQNPEK